MLYNAPFNLKICGITRLEDARYVSGLLANRVGFIFSDESKRYIEPGRAGAIIQWLNGIESVGVFMNQSMDDVTHIASMTGLNMVQLHGQEPPHYCEELPFYTIKTISVSDMTSSDQIQEELNRYQEVVDEFLFDTSIKTEGEHMYGGTGVPFAWEILKELKITIPWYVAGGISPENIHQAWNVIKPTGFDVSSSVESDPGVKDYDLLDRLIESINQVKG